jgi:hypothetical protein
MRRIALLGGLAAALAACAGPTAPPAADGNGWVNLPGAPYGLILGDADRRAAQEIRNTVAVPSRLEGRPDLTARAFGWYEYATVALARPRWIELDALAVPQLRQGRDEARAAFGIKQDAPAQVVLDSFFRAAEALSVNDRIGAVRSFPPGILTVPGEQLVARLEAPPRMVQAERAAAYAGQAVDAHDNRGGGRGRRITSLMP